MFQEGVGWISESMSRKEGVCGGERVVGGISRSADVGVCHRGEGGCRQGRTAVTQYPAVSQETAGLMTRVAVHAGIPAVLGCPEMGTRLLPATPPWNPVLDHKGMRTALQTNPSASNIKQR